MKKIISLLSCGIVLFISLMGLSACLFNCENPFPYGGEHKELYTTAIYSIPTASGYMHHGEGAYNADIYVWEQDDYGRTLFAYCEDYQNRVFALVVSQGNDETHAYFYPDANYALTIIESDRLYEGADKEYLKSRTEDFYLQKRDELKQKNDWNKPIDKSKCVRYSITDHKTLGEDLFLFSDDQCNQILNAYTATLNLPNPENKPHRTHGIRQIDANGKLLHEIHGVHRYYDNPNWKYPDTFTWYNIILWVITDKDGNYDKESGIMVMFSDANQTNTAFVYNAEEVLKFKEQNGWLNDYCTQ